MAENAAKVDVGFPPMEPVGVLTVPEEPQEVPLTARRGTGIPDTDSPQNARLESVEQGEKPPGTCPPAVLEKTPAPPLQTTEKVANVANQEWPKSLRKYRDPEKRRKYMAKLMKTRRAAAKKAKKGKKDGKK
jgi:hypothetical protein